MAFDPYHKWLGIPTEEQPPNHYRLLSVPQFESDADVIDGSANLRSWVTPIKRRIEVQAVSISNIDDLLKLYKVKIRACPVKLNAVLLW